jgi:membrane carboxypeptidase/penicillin-binding protein
MLTLIFRLVTGALTLAAVTLAIGVGFVWYDGSRMMDRAKQTGWLTPAPVEAPLSLFETTVAKGVFGRTWDQKGFPCRTVARMWAYYTGDRTRPPGGLSISQVMARDIAYEVEPSQSIGSQLRQLSLACQLEGHSDTDLLRLWMTHASFGKGLTGPDAAAQALFEKAPGALNAAESAKLAAALSQPGIQGDPAKWTAGAKRVTQHADAGESAGLTKP